MALALFLLALVAALALAYRPLGDYMYRQLTSERDLRVERWIYRSVGVDSRADQPWGAYARSVLAFSVISLLVLYALQRLQSVLPWGLGRSGVPALLSWNTAASFVTNTNWQNYSGETTMGYLVQMAGLTVQNFVSAGVGVAVAIALVRGFARNRTDTLGNFWVDLTRICIRVLLPISVVGALALVASGVEQNLTAGPVASTIAGGTQTITGGPVASQEVIKLLGTNGGGFFNANSAHPFENPTAWTNWLEIFLLLVIGFALPRTFGRMVGSNRQGYAIVAVMAVLAIGATALTLGAQLAHHGTVPTAVGGATEGVEARFGVGDSGVFGSASTLTSTGAVDAMHDSFTALGGGMVMLNMMLGEVAPGGTGSGLYGILILAVVTVFVAGLMVGRTPEYLGKKLRGREIKLASLYLLTTPALVLAGAAVAMANTSARTAMTNVGPHGFSEVLYAFTSAANNNGSAFAGLSANTPFYNVALGVVILLGRFLPMIFVLGLGGSLARQQPVAASAGTLPTHKPLFVGMVVGVTLIVVALTYLPALALGPLAEGLY